LLTEKNVKRTPDNSPKIWSSYLGPGKEKKKEGKATQYEAFWGPELTNPALHHHFLTSTEGWRERILLNEDLTCPVKATKKKNFGKEENEAKEDL